MRRRPLPPLALLAILLLAPLASAQEGDADALLAEVTAAAEAIEDAAFLLTGHLVDPDGTEIPLELEMQIVPPAEVASAYVLQPDALADNIIVLDGDTVYNYTFLTNQVTVFDAGDPDALGGLFGGAAEPEEESFEFTFDLDRLFAGYETSVVGPAEGAEEPATVLRLDNVDEDAAIARAEAVIVDATSLPSRIELFDPSGDTLAVLNVEDLRTDVGLDPDEVTYLPEDAEVIDERGE